MSQVEWLEKELAMKTKQLNAAMRVLHEITAKDIQRKADTFSLYVGPCRSVEA